MEFVMGRGESSTFYSRSISGSLNTTVHEEEDTSDLRRGPWTADEDLLLFNYIKIHGEGRWNSLARYAGLKRTGKSCRLRWLNYLRPDVRRGNITPEEQLLILQLHSRWGNRWSKIAKHLPGRTDNEIKNYWRTRVQKQANQLKCDVNSQQFKDVVQYLWMPRLMEKIRPNSTAATTAIDTTTTLATNSPYSTSTHDFVGHDKSAVKSKQSPENSVEESSMDTLLSQLTSLSPPVSELTGGFYGDLVNWADEIPPPAGLDDEINQGLLDFDDNGGCWGSTCDINIPENFWSSMESMDDFWS